MEKELPNVSYFNLALGGLTAGALAIQYGILQYYLKRDGDKSIGKDSVNIQKMTWELLRFHRGAFLRLSKYMKP